MRSGSNWREWDLYLARSSVIVFKLSFSSTSGRKATDLKRMDSARISCVDCTAGHCNVTCKYPNPSICTRFPSRKYSAVTSLKEISTAATSAGVTVHRPWIRLARSSVSIVPDDTTCVKTRTLHAILRYRSLVKVIFCCHISSMRLKGYS